MRLLYIDECEQIRLTSRLNEDQIPPYAILSHTWGNEEEEVTFQDLTEGQKRCKAGLKKIWLCSKWAREDKIQYFWVDTCCIDKRDSAELSEAIISMFKWYRNAARCYVYLADVTASQDGPAETSKCELYLESRWFTRGWTLQELIAPKDLRFYSCSGDLIGEKVSLLTGLSQKLGIPLGVLSGGSLSEHTFEQRMSWIRQRNTKKSEDKVYCLLGILDISMPPLYGEGYEQALRRLYRILYLRLPSIHRFEMVHFGTSPPLVSWPATQYPLGLSVVRETGKIMSSDDDLDDAELEPNLLSDATEDTSSNYPLDGSSTVDMHLQSQNSPLRGRLESQPSFQPEKYSTGGLGPRLVCSLLYAPRSDGFAARGAVTVFFAVNYRHWVRLELHLMIYKSSKFWEMAVEHVPGNPSKSGWRHLPSSLFKFVQGYLGANEEDLEDDTVVYMDLGAPNPASDRTLMSMRLLENKDNRLMELHRDLRMDIHHLDIPIITDAELQIVYTLSNHDFIARHQGVWLWYKSAAAGVAGFRAAERELREAIALRNLSHVNSLHGVVLGSRESNYKGMLFQVPHKGPLFQLLATAQQSGSPIPWTRRSKWAQQIVKAVAEVHACNISVAILRTYYGGIGIDHDDNVVVSKFFTESLPLSHTSAGLVPPEYRGKHPADVGWNVSRAYDIFLMGSLLWHLYRYTDQVPNSVFCEIAGCPKRRSRAQCTLAHANPVQLPWAADDDPPQYLIDIIKLCRHEDPSQRPAARKLLLLFPPNHTLSMGDTSWSGHSSADTDPSINLGNLEQALQVTSMYIICTLCAGRCWTHSYTCKVCDDGNFDLCQACFEAGKHCEEDSHWLAKEASQLSIYKSYNSISRTEYYLGPDVSGVRGSRFA